MNLKRSIIGGVFACSLMLPTVALGAEYTVKSGDTMSKIADKHNLSLEQLTSYNPQISNINMIYVNQKVNVTMGSSNTVQVNTTAASSNNSSYSESEIDLLARLVRAEAGGESYAGKVAVAAVVLNRVQSSQFPNSISGVVYQSGQFSPVSNGMINKSADSESKRAALEAVNGNDPTNGSLFFYNPKTSTSSWIYSRPVLASIGNHNFAK